MGREYYKRAFNTKNTMNIDLTIKELYDIQTSIEDSIERSNTMIADCKQYGLSDELIQVWIDRRERLTKALDKLTIKPL